MTFDLDFSWSRSLIELMSVTVDMIRARLRQVDDQLAHHDAAAQVLRHEQAELHTALRVLERFGADHDEVFSPEPNLEARRRDLVAAAEAEAEKQAAELERRKPSAAPTVPEMITAVLERRQILNEPGLEPKEILSEIRERWWPDAPSQSVGPIAWRMWKKEGRLRKEGKRYALPPLEEIATNNAPALGAAGGLSGDSGGTD